MTTPTSPIMEHHVEVSQLDGSSMAMVKELLEDHHIQPDMMWSALSAVASLFTPYKTTQLPESDGPKVPHKVSVTSTPMNNDLHYINKELNTCKDRPVLEQNSF